MSRKSCSVGGARGACMWVQECNRVGGIHAGVCVDGFMFGSCCRLPDPPVVQGLVLLFFIAISISVLIPSFWHRYVYSFCVAVFSTGNESPRGYPVRGSRLGFVWRGSRVLFF